MMGRMKHDDEFGEDEFGEIDTTEDEFDGMMASAEPVAVVTFWPSIRLPAVPYTVQITQGGALADVRGKRGVSVHRSTTGARTHSALA